MDTRREGLRVDWVRCWEMKSGLLMRAYQALHTDLNRRRDFTGSLDKISISISMGKWIFALASLDRPPAVASSSSS